MWAETFDPINIDDEVTKPRSLKILVRAWNLIGESAIMNAWRHLTEM
jgi:hypothetical protein